MPDYERDNIRRMVGYTWGEQPNDEATIKLNTNENPYPPTPEVDKALAQLAGANLRRYPQPTADHLRDVIASKHNVERNQVVVTNGGDEALRLAVTTYVDPQTSIAVADPSYSLYPVLAEIHNADMVHIALDENWALPVDFAATVNAAGANLTCLVNPHAPSGTLTPRAQLSDLAEALNGVLLIDEAYVDFIEPDAAYESASLTQSNDNVLILRTFSKGYSLAGMRLAYLLGSKGLIDPIVNKTRDSYNIDHISQAVGLAAFNDQPYAEETWRQVRSQRQILHKALGQLGLSSPVSHANFLLVEVPSGARFNAIEIYHTLKERGILVRHFATPRLQDKIRISIGTSEDNNRLIAILTELLS